MKKLIHPRRSIRPTVAKPQPFTDPSFLATGSRHFLIGNETSSQFCVSHRKQSLGPISNREEFSLFHAAPSLRSNVAPHDTNSPLVRKAPQDYPARELGFFQRGA